MRYSFHPSARIELIDAIEYYNEIQNNLGIEFGREVHLTIHRILRYSIAWPLISTNIRRCLCNRFPYGILYSIVNDEIFIIAVMHMMRKPGYWTDRV